MVEVSCNHDLASYDVGWSPERFNTVRLLDNRQLWGSRDDAQNSACYVSGIAGTEVETSFLVEFRTKGDLSPLNPEYFHRSELTNWIVTVSASVRLTIEILNVNRGIICVWIQRQKRNGEYIAALKNERRRKTTIREGKYFLNNLFWTLVFRCKIDVPFKHR